MESFVSGYRNIEKACKHIRDFLEAADFAGKIQPIHDTSIDGMTIALILVCPGHGIMAVSIRDYTADDITDVPNDKMIKFRNRPVEYSPLLNALNERDAIIKAIKQKGLLFDDRFITIACCYPFMDEQEFMLANLSKLSLRKMTILKDDFRDAESFENKIYDIFDYIYKEQGIHEGCDIPHDALAALGCRIGSDIIGTEGNDGTQGFTEGNVDLDVDSLEELNYGICNFLMKNSITSGEIYSGSKELLDGLGEYMSSVNIPWGYDFDDSCSVGYRFVDGEPPETGKSKGVCISFNGKESILIRQGRERKYDIRIRNRNSIFEELDEVDLASPFHLKNEEIRKMFLKAFKVSKKEIDIISPWMNFGVVNRNFVGLMREALERKVVIKILYGLKPSASEFNMSRSKRSDQVAEYLREEFQDYRNQLFIKRDNIHYKLVLCDEIFKLEGGYNYLSFVGDYEKADTRKEGSPYGTDTEEIRYLRKEYFSCVE